MAVRATRARAPAEAKQTLALDDDAPANAASERDAIARWLRQHR